MDAGPYTEFFSAGISFTLDCPGVVYASSDLFAAYVNGGRYVSQRHFRRIRRRGWCRSDPGGRVVFENCTFRISPHRRASVQLSPTTNEAHLTITDSVFANNGVAAGGGGIIIQPSRGVTATAVIERTQVTGNTYGIVANASAGTVLVEVGTVRSPTMLSTASGPNWGIDCIHCRRAQRIGPKRRQWYQCDRCRWLCVAQRLGSRVECDGLKHGERRHHRLIQEQCDCRQRQTRRDAGERQPAVRNRARRTIPAVLAARQLQ